MWEEATMMPQTYEVTSFLDWMDGFVLGGSLEERARQTFLEAAGHVSVIKRFQTTPQTAPWHTEGPFLDAHVVRILSGLYAVVEGADVMRIEELARHKSLRAEFMELSETIREHAATLIAFALVHDIAKPETLSFDAPKNSLGAKEGFAQHARRMHKHASEGERRLYTKLVKTVEAQNPYADPAEISARMHDLYEIEAHYYRHAQLGASEQFQKEREQIADLYRLTHHDRRILTFIIRNHIDAILFFRKSPSVEKFEVLKARAHKDGLDADDVLDLQLAALFLDTAIGTVQYREGVFAHDMRSVVNMLRAEEASAPHRRKERMEKQRIRQNKRRKRALKKAGLTPEDIFAALEVPFGPARGEILEKIYTFIDGRSTSISLGAEGAPLLPKLKKARTFFDQMA